MVIKKDVRKIKKLQGYVLLFLWIVIIISILIERIRDSTTIILFLGLLILFTIVWFFINSDLFFFEKKKVTTSSLISIQDDKIIKKKNNNTIVILSMRDIIDFKILDNGIALFLSPKYKKKSYEKRINDILINWQNIENRDIFLMKLKQYFMVANIKSSEENETPHT